MADQQIQKYSTFKTNDFLDNMIRQTEEEVDARTIYNDILDDVFLNEIKENL